jgi:hypothetical protein
VPTGHGSQLLLFLKRPALQLQVDVLEVQYMPVVAGVLQTLAPQTQEVGLGAVPSVMLQAATQAGSGVAWHLFSGR